MAFNDLQGTCFQSGATPYYRDLTEPTPLNRLANSVADALSFSAIEISKCLQQLQLGDLDARERLVRSAQNRLMRLTRKMLRDFPGVRRWEETDDVFQTAVIRLCRSLEFVVPQNSVALMRLAARDIRCALIDLARHYGGPQGHGANHDSSGGKSSVLANAVRYDTDEPASLAFWTEFHERVQELPEELQEVMDLLWYQGLTQSEAAAILQVTDRTVQRRWRQACLSLHQTLGGIPFGLDA